MMKAGNAPLIGMAALTLAYAYLLHAVLASPTVPAVLLYLTVLSMPVAWVIFLSHYRKVAIPLAVLLELPAMIAYGKMLLLFLLIV
jgi:hypothetical protein